MEPLTEFHKDCLHVFTTKNENRPICEKHFVNEKKVSAKINKINYKIYFIYLNCKHFPCIRLNVHFQFNVSSHPLSKICQLKAYSLV